MSYCNHSLMGGGGGGGGGAEEHLVAVDRFRGTEEFKT